MWWTVAMTLTVMWLLGMWGKYSAGGLLHLLLIAALVMVLFRVFLPRRAA
jgi:hypothetical protein